MTQEELNYLTEHEKERTKCTVWSRVMGYQRMVEGFNIGKIGEHKERTFFVEEHSINKREAERVAE